MIRLNNIRMGFRHFVLRMFNYQIVILESVLIKIMFDLYLTIV